MRSARTVAAACVAILVSLLPSCAFGPPGSQALRDAADRLHKEVIVDLGQHHRDTFRDVESAAAYGVFANTKISALVLEAGTGYGLVVDGATHDRTYMRTRSLGAGLGIGRAKGHYLMLFDEPNALRRFLDGTVVYVGEATASTGHGEAASRPLEDVGSGLDGVRVFQVDETPFRVSASVVATRFERVEFDD